MIANTIDKFYFWYIEITNNWNIIFIFLASVKTQGKYSGPIQNQTLLTISL